MSYGKKLGSEVTMVAVKAGSYGCTPDGCVCEIGLVPLDYYHCPMVAEAGGPEAFKGTGPLPECVTMGMPDANADTYRCRYCKAIHNVGADTLTCVCNG